MRHAKFENEYAITNACPSCGARMVGGRCPRCHFERRIPRDDLGTANVLTLGGSSGGAPSPVASNLGTAVLADAAQLTSTLTLAGIVVPVTSTIVVMLGSRKGTSYGTATFNGAMTAGPSDTDVTGPERAVIWYQAAVPAGTYSAVATFTGTFPTAAVMIVTQLTGVAASPLDKSASSNGMSSTPSSGATPGLSQPNELAIGFIATNGTLGTEALFWTLPMLAAQTNGSNIGIASDCTCFEGRYATSTTDPATAAGSPLNPSTGWVALVATFKGL